MICEEIVYKQPHTDEVTFTVTSSSSHMSGWIIKVRDLDYENIEHEVICIKKTGENKTEITIKLEKVVPISQGTPHINMTVSNEAFEHEMKDEWEMILKKIP